MSNISREEAFKLLKEIGITIENRNYDYNVIMIKLHRRNKK